MTHKNGITKRRDPENYRTQELPEIVGIHKNLLQTPLFALSEQAAKSLVKITAIIGRGVFSMSMTKESAESGLGLPTAKHAEYFYVLCAYLADNWNEEGIVYFKFSSILKDLGKNPRSQNSIDALKETIRRYQGCSTKWINCFDEETNKDNVVTFPLIRTSSLFKNPDDGEPSIVNARNDRNKKNWNWIQFDPFIVEACNPNKNPQTRLFLTSIFKSKGSERENIIYRYFYGIGDIHYQWHSVFREPDGLIHQFHWTSPKRKFLSWLSDGLNGLTKRGLIDKYEFSDDRKSVRVKCRNIVELSRNDNIVIDADSIESPGKNSRKGASRGSAKDVLNDPAASLKDFIMAAESKNIATRDMDKMSDLDIIETYLNLKQKKLIEKDKIETIDSILNVFRGKKAPKYVVESIKSVISG